MQQQQPNPSSYVYGSLALHISGDTSTTLNTMCDCSEEHALLGSEGQAFYRDGYCIVDAAADDVRRLDWLDVCHPQRFLLDGDRQCSPLH